jgi:hypothetical protein
MDSAANRAFKKIFSKEPEGLEQWELAQQVLKNFNITLIGEELAKDVILETVNSTQYPDRETLHEVVGLAEGFASEIFDEYNKHENAEPHMAELEWIQNQRRNNLR